MYAGRVHGTHGSLDGSKASDRDAVQSLEVKREIREMKSDATCVVG